MGIEDRRPGEPKLHHDDATSLIQTLQSESVSEAEKEGARTVLMDLRSQHLAARTEIIIAKGDKEGGPGSHARVMERRKSFDDRAEREMEIVRTINRALGLPEDEKSRDL